MINALISFFTEENSKIFLIEKSLQKFNQEYADITLTEEQISILNKKNLEKIANYLNEITDSRINAGFIDHIL